MQQFKHLEDLAADPRHASFAIGSFLEQILVDATCG